MKKEIHVLYLEDVPADAVNVERELREAGVIAHTQRVESKEEFLRELEKAPDVILSDHGVPAFDGITALGIARRKCPDIPFIFVTDALSREMEIEKLVGGVADYVRKSELEYLPVAVLHALHEAGERRAQKQRLRDYFNSDKPAEANFLTICSHCKRIRDKQNEWKSPDIFFHEYLNIKFTHGICPTCIPQFFPGGWRKG